MKTTCPGCKKSIQYADEFAGRLVDCRVCKTRQTLPTRRLRGLRWLAASAVLAALSATAASFMSPVAHSPAAQATLPGVHFADVIRSEFQDEYDMAKKKYSGKTMYFYGEVTGLKNGWLTLYAMDFSEVKCRLSGPVPFTIQEGGWYLLRGRNEGSVLGNPIFHDCVVIKPVTDTDALRREFAGK